MKAKKKRDIIDNINEYLRAVHIAKLCPKCGGALLQHQSQPRALFCSSCFSLYGLTEFSVEKWIDLVHARFKEDKWRRKGAFCSKIPMCECTHGLPWHKLDQRTGERGECRYEYHPDGNVCDCPGFRLLVTRAETKRRLKKRSGV